MSCCLEQDPPLSLSTVYHKSTQTCYDRIALEIHVSGPRRRAPKRQTLSNKPERASPAMSCCLEQDPPLSLSTVYRKSTQTCYDRIALEIHVGGPKQRAKLNHTCAHTLHNCLGEWERLGRGGGFVFG